MTTQPQKKRTYQKKTTNQNSQKIDFKSLTLTELIEKAQWYKSQLTLIETYIKEEVNKLVPLHKIEEGIKSLSDKISSPTFEPPFTQGYNPYDKDIILSSANRPKVGGDISFSGMIGTPITDKRLDTPNEFKAGDQIIKPMEPVAEVYEIIGDKEEKLLLDDINNLLGN